MSTLARNFRPSVWYLLPLLACGALALVFLPKMLVVAGAASIVALAILILVAGLILDGKVEHFVLAWVLLFPLGPYFLNYPREQGIIFTLNRALLGALIVAMAVAHGHRERFLHKPLRDAGIAWSLFVLATVLSLRLVENPPGMSKLVADAFVLPGLLAYYVIRYFPVRRWLPTLHVFTSLMVIYCTAIGVAELVTGQDLLPIAGGTVILEETGQFLRVNGPFASNHVFGMVGLLSLWFLLFAGRALRPQIAGSWLLLHRVAIVSAFAMAIMPMFRSMAISLVVVVLLELYWNRRRGVRLAAALVLVFVLAGILALGQLAPKLFAARVSDPSDLYSRIAQQEQTLLMFIEHPLNGVGLSNYNQVASDLPLTQFRGASSVGWPHNNFAAVLAETGLAGFVPYVLAQVLLFQAFWKMRKQRGPDAVLASTFFLYVFVAYTLNGFLLTSGYDSDLNFWYLFVIAVLYKFALTADPPARAQQFLIESAKWVR